jgi:hypothetical protein
MKNIKDIKNDIGLEPFFLDYIKCEEEATELPDEMPKNISSEESERIIKLAYRADIALENLVEEINRKYKTEFEIDEIEEEDEIAELLNETCDLYVEKYTIEYILARPLAFIGENDLDLSEFLLENDMNICVKCNSEKEEIHFDDLPEEIKKEFDDVKDKTEYYLFCPECKEYSIITPN